MTLSVRWSARAAEQLLEAAQRLESARVGAGVRLVDEVEATLAQAAEHPLANPAIPGEPANTRKAIIARFGYWIIYEVDETEIVILTVWSAVREPDSWRNA